MTLQEPSSSPGAQSEALVFLSFFGDLPDPRQAGKVIYPLQEVLLLCLLAVLAGANTSLPLAQTKQSFSCLALAENRLTSADVLKPFGYQTVALRRQRSHVRIVSGAPFFSYFTARYARTN
jgi:hypothetical protein